MSFRDDEMYSGSLKTRQEKDEERKNACKEVGITLIPIPYWWDGRKDSLLATISKIRPDLTQGMEIKSFPIAEEMEGKLPKRSRKANLG